jgi:hypothetical protein
LLGDLLIQSYTLDRMVSMLLGRPVGISDDDIDVDLPSVETLEEDEDLPQSSMVSAVHYIKLKQIESEIQRKAFSVRNKKTLTANDVWAILNSISIWENSIPAEASQADHLAVPCCSRDWFLLRGVEARLHLLRHVCTEGSELISTFLPQLALNAAKGCDLQYVISLHYRLYTIHYTLHADIQEKNTPRWPTSFKHVTPRHLHLRTRSIVLCVPAAKHLTPQRRLCGNQGCFKYTFRLFATRSDG